MAKNILLISYNYYPELTGIGKYNTEFCEYLQAAGNRVTVITGFPYYPNWKLFKGYVNTKYTREIIQGVTVIRCPLFIPAQPNGSKRILQDFSFYFSSLLVVLQQLFCFTQYDIVITPSPSFLNGLHGLLWRLFYKKTAFVYHIQDLQIDAALELGIIRIGWVKQLLLAVETLILKKASVVSTISDGMRRKILSKNNKLKVVTLFPNWVDNTLVFKQPADLSIITGLGIDLEKKVFFYSGAIGEKQGLEIILDIAPGLALSAPSLLFVISGSGPYKKKLQARILDLGITNILFIKLQPTVIFNHLLNYAHCHLIIQKIQTGGDLFLPSKLANILAVGGLSIVTASPGSSLYDIVYNNNIGIVTPPENEQLLTEKILSVHYQV